MGTDSKKFKKVKTSSSELKTKIVLGYYIRWINIMISNFKRYGNYHNMKKHFAYIDLFAGSGSYDDGSYGTAVEIMKHIVEHQEQIDSVETVFNDAHKESIESLSGCINEICSNIQFKYPPKFFNEKVGMEFVNKILTQKIPILFFLDPWGYKGLSLEAIRLGSKNFGCDGFFFFNYSGINRCMQKKSNLLENLRLLFNSEADKLVEEVQRLAPEDREERIVQAFEQEVRKINGVFVSKFRFMKPDKNGTSHMLYHVSKDAYGFKVFKDTIAELNPDRDGFPVYWHDPKNEHYACNLFHEFSSQKEELAETLLNKFKGQKITFKNICEKHLSESLFTDKNHRKSLICLEEGGKIQVNRLKKNGSKISKGTYPDEALICFPE